MADRVLFGASLGAWNGADVSNVAEVLEVAGQADRDGLDLFTLADHPYFGEKVDAYMAISFILGRTANIAGAAIVTNLPSRPAPMLARTVTSLSALSGGRVVLGIGAGFLWDQIVTLGVPRLSPGAAVNALEEAITLVRALSGGGDRVTFHGDVYQVTDVAPAEVATPPIWTGSVGAKSLAVTGRLADGWVPSGGSDWLGPVYRQGRPVIDEAAAAAGRKPEEIVTIFNFGGRITDAPLRETRDGDGRWIGGSPDQWVEEMTGAVRDHGAAGFIYRTTDDTPPAAAVRRWAQEVVPAVREAVGAD